MAHYETWFKTLWNECVTVLDENPDLAEHNPESPLASLLETMHAIADGEEDMWLEVPGGNPILRLYYEHEIPAD